MFSFTMKFKKFYTKVYLQAFSFVFLNKSVLGRNFSFRTNTIDYVFFGFRIQLSFRRMFDNFIDISSLCLFEIKLNITATVKLLLYIT